MLAYLPVQVSRSYLRDGMGLVGRVVSTTFPSKWMVAVYETDGTM